MDRSAVTYTRGRRWWLERVTIKGNQRYPEIIKVGELGKERLYIPEKRYAKLSKVAREMLSWCDKVMAHYSGEGGTPEDVSVFRNQLEALGVVCDEFWMASEVFEQTYEVVNDAED